MDRECKAAFKQAILKSLEPAVTDARLSALDDRFDRVPEDLAVFTMRYLGRADGDA